MDECWDGIQAKVYRERQNHGLFCSKTYIKLAVEAPPRVARAKMHAWVSRRKIQQGSHNWLSLTKPKVSWARYPPRRAWPRVKSDADDWFYWNHHVSKYMRNRSIPLPLELLNLSSLIWDKCGKTQLVATSDYKTPMGLTLTKRRRYIDKQILDFITVIQIHSADCVWIRSPYRQQHQPISFHSFRSSIPSCYCCPDSLKLFCI